jgi:hypothetical protein
MSLIAANASFCGEIFIVYVKYILQLIFLGLNMKEGTLSTFKIDNKTKTMLKKLSKLQDRSMTGVLQYLIKKEAREYGLVEPRD